MKPEASSELGWFAPHETNEFLSGYERPEPTAPAASATAPAAVPPLPEPEASTAFVSFMCQTPL